MIDGHQSPHAAPVMPVGMRRRILYTSVAFLYLTVGWLCYGLARATDGDPYTPQGLSRVERHNMALPPRD
jgi:hypothetical protein